MFLPYYMYFITWLIFAELSFQNDNLMHCRPVYSQKLDFNYVQYLSYMVYHMYIIAGIHYLQSSGHPLQNRRDHQNHTKTCPLDSFRIVSISKFPFSLHSIQISQDCTWIFCVCWQLQLWSWCTAVCVLRDSRSRGNNNKKSKLSIYMLFCCHSSLLNRQVKY